MTARPYVSVAFVNRNDGYGGDLEQRIETFIAYYAHYARRWPGLFEFVICDWNPPEGARSLRDAFPWKELGDVLHVEVSPAVHARVAGTRGRKMLDYVGRNVAIRRGRGEFSLVLNQDIFVSEGILEWISRRSLDPRSFYRADRCDFDFERCRGVPPAAFAAAARAAVFCVHRRHQSTDEPISVPATPEQLVRVGSRPEPGDRLEPGTGMIDCAAGVELRARDARRRWVWQAVPFSRPAMRKWHDGYAVDAYHRRFYLHTNASGDFILAPRKAFDDVHGMVETTDFYMHLDTYAIVQLFAAGYGQRIFAQPHCVYHADHDRSGRADFEESISWPEHEAALSAMLRGERPYQVNGARWGLADDRLPEWRLPG